MIIIGAVALIAFGPDQLPKVARKAGQAIRDVQNTSQSFIREMERAADEQEHRSAWEPPTAAPPDTDVAHEPQAMSLAESHGATPATPEKEGERDRAALAREIEPPV